MTAKEIEIDRKIAYNKRMSKTMNKVWIGCLTVVIIGFVGFTQLFIDQKDKLSKEKLVNDTVYIYYRGEQGYIRFFKVTDFNPIYDHSEIIKPIDK